MNSIEFLKSEVARLESDYRKCVVAERLAEKVVDIKFRNGVPESMCEAYWMEFVDATAIARAALVEAEIALKCAVNGWNRAEVI